MKKLLLLSLILLSPCNRITPSSTLPDKEIKHIQKIGLLDKNETIIHFYSGSDMRRVISLRRIA